MDRMLRFCERLVICARIPHRLAELDHQEHAWANDSSLAAAGEHGDDAIEDYLHALDRINAERARLEAMLTACADERRSKAANNSHFAC